MTASRVLVRAPLTGSPVLCEEEGIVKDERKEEGGAGGGWE